MKPYPLGGVESNQPAAKYLIPAGLVLAGFPFLYQLASRSSVAEAFFAGDRSYFSVVIAAILVLHWSSFAAAMIVSRRLEIPAEHLGWPRWATIAWTAGLLLLLGFVLVLFRELISYEGGSERAIQLLPQTTGERSLFVVSALTAGICEEFVYRAFGIRLLQRAGLPTFAAVLLPSAAWVMIHGQVSLVLFGVYLVIGLGFSALYLWRRNLLVPLVVHALLDLAVILAP
jgi:membrane protease YdiL (CAAX protease family)